MIYSDHCPVNISMKIEISPSMDIVYECSRACFSDDCYDVNKRLKVPINMHRVNIRSAVNLLNEYANELKDRLMNNMMDNNTISIQISDCIYDACKKSYEKNHSNEITTTPNMQNCTAKNFKAIADANRSTYLLLSKSERPPEEYLVYLENWMAFEKLAQKSENDELNVAINSSWKNCQKDGKKLWNMIDWKGKAEIQPEEQADEREIMNYFKDIFQSKKTENHPKINSIMCDVESCDLYIPILDDMPTMEELEKAIARIGSGVSLDGIPPSAVRILPLSMKELILSLIQRVFFGDYPDEWTKQILHSIKKDGHTPENPKLRGIAIAPLLARLYLMNDSVCGTLQITNRQVFVQNKVVNFSCS